MEIYIAIAVIWLLVSLVAAGMGQIPIFVAMAIVAMIPFALYDLLWLLSLVTNKPLPFTWLVLVFPGYFVAIWVWSKIDDRRYDGFGRRKSKANEKH